MTTNVLVLGYGYIGEVTAGLLADHYRVTVLDPNSTVNDERLVYLRDKHLKPKYFKGIDLVVNCLPSRLSPKVVKACIKNKVPLVDVSYADPLPGKDVHKAAVEAGIPMLFDCGVDPGLVNMAVGKVIAEEGQINSGTIYLGGMAESPAYPFGYSVTWSPEDLLNEYERPARFVENGKICKAKALSELETIIIKGNEYEAFLVDNLRSLTTNKNVNNLKAKTLRWPGHVKAVTPLIENGTFIKTIKKECSNIPDIVIGKVILNDRIFVLEEDGGFQISAMQKCTAGSCAAFARLVIEHDLKPGIWSPEQVGENSEYYKYVIDELGIICYFGEITEEER